MSNPAKFQRITCVLYIQDFQITKFNRVYMAPATFSHTNPLNISEI